MPLGIRQNKVAWKVSMLTKKYIVTNLLDNLLDMCNVKLRTYKTKYLIECNAIRYIIYESSNLIIYLFIGSTSRLVDRLWIVWHFGPKILIYYNFFLGLYKTMQSSNTT